MIPAISRMLRSFHPPVRFSGAAVALFLLLPGGPVSAGEANPALQSTHKEIEQVFGKVPEFLKALPQAALPGAWSELKAISLADNTALPPKMKALISLAVAAQIPCGYCIWSDTQDAKHAGASDEEIKEAVAVAALTRHWSTILNGMQVDMATFKKDLGGNVAAAQ